MLFGGVFPYAFATVLVYVTLGLALGFSVGVLGWNGGGGGGHL